MQIVQRFISVKVTRHSALFIKGEVDTEGHV